MRIGVVYPQIEFPTDPAAIRDYAQAVEALGYTHILAYDHVLGANPDRSGGWTGPYNYRNPFMEVFVLFSYLAGLTRSVELVTGILILPQRQTALVAKQAATLDVLSGGRLRLGIGIGWNAVEYEALGQDFHTRGKRSEEQVTVLRGLWTEPLVTYAGRWHHIPDAGILPLPVQRPIPIWFGGQAEPVLRRCARLGDGWMPNTRSPEAAKPLFEQLDTYLEEAGRSRDGFGIEPRLSYGEGHADEWAATFAGWQKLGATHLSVNTMGAGFTTPDQHLTALRRLADVLGVGG